jgi:hypothetical protein
VNQLKPEITHFKFDVILLDFYRYSRMLSQKRETRLELEIFSYYSGDLLSNDFTPTQHKFITAELISKPRTSSSGLCSSSDTSCLVFSLSFYYPLYKSSPMDRAVSRIIHSKSSHIISSRLLQSFPSCGFSTSLRKSCVLKHATAVKIKGSIEVTGR